MIQPFDLIKFLANKYLYILWDNHLRATIDLNQSSHPTFRLRLRYID